MILLAAAEKQVLAYGDPGSGALAWQLIAAAVFGWWFYAHKIADKIRGAFAAMEAGL